MKEKAYKPMNIHELSVVLGLQTDDEMSELIQLLNQMEDQGLVVRTRTHCYGLPEKMDLVVGHLQAKSKGFGFVIPDTPGAEDVYIQAGDMRGALHGDRVIARIHRRSSGPKLEGAIIRILQRVNTKIVGTLMATRHYAFVKPDDPRISIELFIPTDQLNGALDGQKVVADIVRYPEEFRAPEGTIVEVLGNPDAPGVDILSVIRKYGLPEQFPDPVLEQADRVPDQIALQEIQGRRDLRDWKMVTIDGADAKDLDDAVNVKQLENGNILLGVHIADVAYYVREGSPLDQEAYNRGTSVYLVDRVIPMLPQRLSNGICSLIPRVDRLTLTCEMEWTPQGEKVRSDIYASVIRTNERMTYDEVKRILTEEPPELMERYQDLIDDFRLMEELAAILRNRRMRRGAIDFDFPETKILVDEKGKPFEIKKRERSVAEQLIEEFMLAANETVAEAFHMRGLPFLYRIHEKPDGDRIKDLAEFVHNFGYSLKVSGSGADKVLPKLIQQLLEQIKGTTEERIISTITLRSMKQAKYSAEALGHFGLASEYYSHFTSPIRRYPDLQIHRIIREVLVEGSYKPDREEHYRQILAEVAQHSSERERNAVDAERETDELKKMEYMLDKIGEEFEGIVSGVAQYGIFVELDNNIEGLVHVSYLADDYYHYHEKSYALVGERTGRTFRIGDRVKIRVENVSKEQRQMDFILLEGGYVRGEYVYRDTTKGSFRREQAAFRARQDFGESDKYPYPSRDTKVPYAKSAKAAKGKKKQVKGKSARAVQSSVSRHAVEQAKPVFGKVRKAKSAASRSAKKSPVEEISYVKVEESVPSRRTASGPKKMEPFYDVFTKKKRK